MRWKTFIILCSKYIQDNKHIILSESAWFCRRCDKNILCVLGFAVPIAVHLQYATLSFTRQCCDIIQLIWKTFKLLYRKFIQDNVYQILSKSTGFCGRYYKNILVCFFGSQCSLKRVVIILVQPDEGINGYGGKHFDKRKVLRLKQI